MVGRNIFELFLSNLEFGTEKNRDPGIEIDVSCRGGAGGGAHPPPPPPPPSNKKKKSGEEAGVVLLTSLRCSLAEEVSPSQALLSLPHNAPS